jgi:hypothetical protein
MKFCFCALIDLVLDVGIRQLAMAIDAIEEF